MVAPQAQTGLKLRHPECDSFQTQVSQGEFDQRRATDRPERGDERECPNCGGRLRFDDRYQVGLRGTVVQTAAWRCGNGECLHTLLVRESDLEGES